MFEHAYLLPIRIRDMELKKTELSCRQWGQEWQMRTER